MNTTNYTYLLINLLVLVGPLIANIYFKVSGFKFFLKNFAKTFLVVGIPFILWDTLITHRGDWSFNPLYTIGVKVGNIPLEEALFFFCIPFATMALYELVNIKFKEKRIKIHNSIFYFLSLTFLILSFIFNTFVYTNNIFLLLSVLFLVVAFTKTNNIFYTKNFYLLVLVSYIPFLIVNGILTALPVVIYSNTAITNFRLHTIPFEDLFYSFLMISTYLFVYYIFKNQNKK